jgi:glycosyltransferase involved in cell wall biosynthesis
VKVFLLTSQPLAPPWNSGDKNLARTLLLGEAGVDFIFVGEHYDPSPWPRRHQRLIMRSTGFMPSGLERLRLLRRLIAGAPQVDVTHLMVTFQGNRVTPWVLGALPFIRNRPFVVTCPAGGFYPVRLLRRASAVVALSARTTRRLREEGVDSVHLMPPGVDLERFAPETVLHGWADLGAGDGPFLLFAGHYDAHGGLEQALDVFARVRRRVPRLRLITAMRHRHNQNGAKMRRRLAGMAASRGLDGAVIELGAMTNMAAAIHASHVVLFQPSRLGLKMELPLTLLEALACGRPVVVSNVETLPEIGGPPAVRVCPPDDPALVDHLVDLIEDEHLFAKASAAARSLAERRYDAAAMVSSYSALYRSL